MSKINIKNLEKSFGDNKVINNFNIDINDGEFIVLVGPSGCGKSTLLRMISGLESIDQGEIFLDSKLINNLIPSKREIAMVFQSYALYPHMNVFENMSFGLKMEKISKDQIQQKVNHAANTLQIEDQLKRKPKQLSGGQRQRVAIGRAITRSPKVFLFDEPLSNLDAALRSEMRVEISKLHKKMNSNIIYVTHDQIEAMTLADRIVVLNKGNIEQFGTPNEIYSDPNNIFVAEFIGSPKMNIIKINKDQIINSKTLKLFNNEVAVDNFKFEDEIYIGIRPEDISINNNQEIQLEVKVDLVENLGFEKIIHTKILDHQIIIKSSENVTGQSLKISFSKSKILFFDKNKNRIRLINLNKKFSLIIFTDLDGSLLHRDNFKFDEIKEYIKSLKDDGITIVPNTSKTEKEIKEFTKELGLELPFISENGSLIKGLDLINANFPNNIILSRDKQKLFEIFNSKVPEELKKKCKFILDMNEKQQIDILGLKDENLKNALDRKYTIPFLFEGTKLEKNQLAKVLKSNSLTMQEGGRVINLGDKTDKVKSMNQVLKIFKKIEKNIKVIAVGDNFNDLDMLRNCDIPCLVFNDHFKQDQINIDNLIVSNKPSPEGWADVIKMALVKLDF